MIRLPRLLQEVATPPYLLFMSRSSSARELLVLRGLCLDITCKWLCRQLCHVLEVSDLVRHNGLVDRELHLRLRNDVFRTSHLSRGAIEEIAFARKHVPCHLRLSRQSLSHEFLVLCRGGLVKRALLNLI